MSYIEREELIEGRVSNDPVRIAAMCAPAADVAPVVHGEWKRDIGDRHSSGEYRYCTLCGKSAFHLYGIGDDYKYCPNCGALMDGGEKRE